MGDKVKRRKIIPVAYEAIAQWLALPEYAEIAAIHTDSTTRSIRVSVVGDGWYVGEGEVIPIDPLVRWKEPTE